jgi:hypothetical protein
METAMRALILAACLLALATAARAADATPEVVVVAPSPKIVPKLVERFGEPFSGDRLARWNGPVCPYVMGLTLAHDGFIAGRIGEVAKAAGVPIDPGACEPNLVVVISADADALRKAVARRGERVFSDGRWPADTLQLAAFAKDDGLAAHVFYLNGTALASSGRGGSGLSAETAAPPASAVGLSALLFGPPTVSGWLPSRLTPHVEPALQRVVLILDGRKVEGLTLAQISGYAAMVTLAEVRVDKPLSEVGTITALFADREAGRAPAQDLTFWDRAYLGALYNAPAQSGVALQRSAMALRIQHAIEVLQVAPAGAAAPTPPAAKQP